jgi:hypothetical protein
VTLFVAIGVFAKFDDTPQLPPRDPVLLVFLGYFLILAGALYRSAYLQWAANRRVSTVATRQDAHPHGIMTRPDDGSYRQP